jgi:hypothetical protein
MVKISSLVYKEYQKNGHNRTRVQAVGVAQMTTCTTNKNVNGFMF